MTHGGLTWDSFLFALIAVLASLFLCTTEMEEKRGSRTTAGTEIKLAHYPAGDQSGNEQQILCTSKSIGHIPTPLHVVVSQETICLFTVLFKERKTEFEFFHRQIPIQTSKLFHTLFRTLISPNAP